MELYSRDTIKYCNKRVFGRTYFYQSYEFKYCENNMYYTLEEFNKLEGIGTIYLEGKNRIKNNQLYLTVNEYDFFDECKRIGKRIFDILLTDIKQLTIFDQFGIFHIDYRLYNRAIFSNINLLFEVIKPFIKKYGIPINHDLIIKSIKSETNFIDFNLLCIYFILIHIISDLAGHHNKEEKIKYYYTILNIPIDTDKNDLILKLLNLDYSNDNIEKFKIEYINNEKFINCTKNIFSFAFERLKMNIIQKNNDFKSIIRTNDNGIPLIKENKKGKNARKIDRKVPTDEIELKKYNAAKQQRSHDKLIEEYDKIMKWSSYIEKHDKAGTYYKLVETAYSIKYKTRYKRSLYPHLYDDIRLAHKNIKIINNKNDN